MVMRNETALKNVRKQSMLMVVMWAQSYAEDFTAEVLMLLATVVAPWDHWETESAKEQWISVMTMQELASNSKWEKHQIDYSYCVCSIFFLWQASTGKGLFFGFECVMGILVCRLWEKCLSSMWSICRSGVLPWNKLGCSNQGCWSVWLQNWKAWCIK